MKTQLFPTFLFHLRDSAQHWAAKIEQVFYQPHPIDSRVRPEPHQIILEKGKVLNLTKDSTWHSVGVRSGMVWLTETPAADDHVLRAGSAFTVQDNLPVVIQALEDSVVLLA